MGNAREDGTVNLMRRQRRQIELTQASLAGALSVTRQAVSLWELGRRRPSPEVRQELARLLGLPEPVLFPPELRP